MIKTKIVCTIGPVSESYEMLYNMYKAGMNIARFNMSHGDHASHSIIMNRVHELNRNIEFPVGLLLDTKGPEIRTGNSDFDLKEGDVVEVSVEGEEDPTRTSLYVGYPDLIKSVEVGGRLTIDNGLINLEILDKQKTSMNCKVLDGGYIKGRRHVNLPGADVNLPSITEKDREDILFGLEHDVDFIALSFVRTGENILELKELLGDRGKQVKIIAKIENQQGVDNLEDIVQESDGIMVARGDLGVEVNIEDLPHIQRRIAYLCGRNGKRVIVATHLLESMIDNPIPTRAEVTDVANAVHEDADAVMLSGETTVGKYPLKCIEHLAKMAIKTESYPSVQFAARELVSENKKQHIANSAVRLARQLKCKGLVVITRSGRSAECVSNCRTFGFDTFAFTNNQKSYRMMTLMRSINPFQIEFEDPEETIATAFSVLKERQIAHKGDQMVIISDVRVENGTIDSIQVRPVY
ncbi:MAG: pyruvate kinase [SAR324 cluster bacterium]|nr:pyruvate kinase [SAR324 cluster bacterium]